MAEFSYNNTYQSSLQMAPFEALYGRRCRTPLSWFETGERKIFGPDLVTEAEDKVKIIQANLKARPPPQRLSTVRSHARHAAPLSPQAATLRRRLTAASPARHASS
jgi:hypothetical protein